MWFHNQKHKQLTWTLLIVFVVVATAGTFIVSMQAKPKYLTSLSIAVNRVNRQTTVDYQYDGYYALQASDLFSQTLLSWFLTPSVLLDFYQKAGVDPHITTTNELVSRFRARKFAAQNIVIQFTDANRDTAQKLADGISAVVHDRSASLDKTSSGDATFDVVPSQAVIVEAKPNVLLNTLAAFVASIFFGLAAVWTVRALQRDYADRH